MSSNTIIITLIIFFVNCSRNNKALSKKSLFPTYNLYEIESKISTTIQEIQEEKINHILHIILLIPTAGLWLFVWIYLALFSERASNQAKLKNLYKIRAELLQNKENSRNVKNTSFDENNADEVNINIHDKKEIKNLRELKKQNLITSEYFERLDFIMQKI